MKTKPRAIVLIAAGHVIAPWINMLFSALLLRVGLTEYFSLLLLNATPLNIGLNFAIFPIAGVAIYMMKRWSYPVFLISIGFAFLQNFIAWRNHPQVFNLSMLISSFALNILVVSYFLIPSVRAAYFDPRLRWWESKPRYPVDIPANFQGTTLSVRGPCQITNMSKGGLFIHSEKSLEVRTKILIQFQIMNHPFEFPGTIVHENSNGGYGIRYDHNKQTMKTSREIVLFLSQITKPQKRIFNSHERIQNFKRWVLHLLSHGQGLFPEYQVPQKTVEKPKKRNRAA